VDDGRNVGERERATLHVVLEVAARDIFHRNEQVPLFAASIMHHEDIWVREPRHRPRLDLESLDEGWIGGVVGRQHLHGDMTIKVRLIGAIDPGHAALAYQLLDHTMAKRLANELVNALVINLLCHPRCPSCGERPAALAVDEDQQRLADLDLVAVFQHVLVDALAIDERAVGALLIT